MLSFILSILMFAQPGEASAQHGLSVNSSAPQIVSTDVDGQAFNLKNELKKTPVVLVFYRGGWCPYCNVQLRELQAEVVPKLGKAQLVAISVDKVDEAVKSKKQEGLGFRVLSDSDASIIKAYNVKYKVPQELVTKYKNSYSIDLEKSSGKKHHIIAVPAVFVIAKDGKIRFAYANEDYKTRAQNSDILKSLKKL